MSTIWIGRRVGKMCNTRFFVFLDLALPRRLVLVTKTGKLKRPKTTNETDENILKEFTSFVLELPF